MKKLTTTMIVSINRTSKKRAPKIWEKGYAEEKKARLEALNKRFGLTK